MTVATERINMRVSEDARSMIDRAAELQGVDRTAFMLDASVSRARSVLVEDAVLQLTATEGEQVRELLEQDAAPNEALQRALQRLGELGL